MFQKISRMKRLAIILVVIQAILLIATYFIWGIDIILPAILLVIEAAVLFYLFDRFEVMSQEQSIGVRSALGAVAAEAYEKGGIGIIEYDDDYVINWMSELFDKRGINRIGKKILTWLPEADDLISGKAESVVVKLDDSVYELRRKEDAPIILFKDITDVSYYEDKYNNEKVVIGLASFDNYEESTQYEDEADVATINNAIRMPLTEYCQEFGILTKRLNHYRYLLVLNEEILNKVMSDNFSVLTRVRKAAQKVDVAITLSLAFARGSSDFAELDEMAFKLMDLAQTRGGDQVAVQATGEEVRYFGGQSEATEKRSRVRVRVMSHTLRDLMMKSSNVIICGHKIADFDCIGSAICLSRMATALHKDAIIIAKTGGVEEKLTRVLSENEKELKEQVTFVTESEALNHLQNNTLVIMTDHHNLQQSNGVKVLERAKKVAIVDHHRRSTDIGVKPILLYIEAGASSTCELLTEMIPYVSNHTDINELCANIMLAGMTIDTNRWRNRTGARTYDAASALRKLGADPQVVDEFLKDSFDEFSLKSQIMSDAVRYTNGVVIATVEDRIISRSMMSQVADSLLSIQDVNASFVIANDGDNQTSISARSAGKINVQVIMERMQGGGHMTAAATKRPRMDIDELKDELINVLEEYFKEDSSNESDS